MRFDIFSPHKLVATTQKTPYKNIRIGFPTQKPHVAKAILFVKPIFLQPLSLLNIYILVTYLNYQKIILRNKVPKTLSFFFPILL
jgi:hypothetical protein